VEDRAMVTCSELEAGSQNKTLFRN
jgi:hypothetical protein